eukprot:9806690-Ditylum_brightwellii.AAC.1
MMTDTDIALFLREDKYMSLQPLQLPPPQETAQMLAPQETTQILLPQETTPAKIAPYNGIETEDIYREEDSLHNQVQQARNALLLEKGLNLSSMQDTEK